MIFDVESLGYSLLTAVIGMGIVFFALTALSVVMRLLCLVFESPAITEVSEKPSRDEQESGKIESHTQNTKPIPTEVILAGAVAYLQYEARERAASAVAWSNMASQSNHTHGNAGGWHA